MESKTTGGKEIGKTGIREKRLKKKHAMQKNKQTKNPKHSEYIVSPELSIQHSYFIKHAKKA